MKVCVFGLWHLGTVTAACLADAGHDVVALDPQDAVISNLNRAQSPLFEPGLDDLLSEVIDKGHILFTTDVEDALCDAEMVWVTFDTPVNDEDEADVNYVLEHIETVFPYLQNGTVVLISSQLPVGTTRKIIDGYAQSGFDRDVTFAVSPENLRLGNAIHGFKNPDRIVVGVRDGMAEAKIELLLQPITTRIEWMSIESAEMTKHALNTFLATSITFANEIAVLCEQVGADAKEVERGLKTEPRIGPGAYLSPGAAFSGGTLARDIAFLGQLANHHKINSPLIESIKISNDYHKMWAFHRLQKITDVDGKTVAILGLAYKPETDTPRRSLAVEIAKRLHELGATLHAHDAHIKNLPEELEGILQLHPVVGQAIQPANIVIVSTAWIGYHELEPSLFSGKIVLDANGILRESLADAPNVEYYSVGKS